MPALPLYRGRTDLCGLPACPRFRDFLDVCWQAQRHRLGVHVPPEQARIGLWADPSQGVQRALVRHKPPTICQSSMPYSFEKDVMLSAHDLLALQGFPEPFRAAPPSEFVDSELRSLGGEAFFLPSAMTIVLAYYLNPSAPWGHNKAQDTLQPTPSASS